MSCSHFLAIEFTLTILQMAAVRFVVLEKGPVTRTRRLSWCVLVIWAGSSVYIAPLHELIREGTSECHVATPPIRDLFSARVLGAVQIFLSNSWA